MPCCLALDFSWSFMVASRSMPFSKSTSSPYRILSIAVCLHTALLVCCIRCGVTIKKKNIQLHLMKKTHCDLPDHWISLLLTVNVQIGRNESFYLSLKICGMLKTSRTMQFMLRLFNVRHIYKTDKCAYVHFF